MNTGHICFLTTPSSSPKSRSVESKPEASLMIVEDDHLPAALPAEHCWPSQFATSATVILLRPAL
jgi:hypothetical protein